MSESSILDISQAIEAKSDQMNADDLIGKPLTIRVSKVTLNQTDQPVNIYYEGGDPKKPYKPCKSMLRLISAFWGIDANGWIGKSMTLYRDPDTTWAGQPCGGIRISHLSGLDKAETVSLQQSKNKRKLYTVEPLVEQKPTPKAPSMAVVIKSFNDAETPEVLRSKYAKAQTFDEFRGDSKIDEAYQAKLNSFEGGAK